MNRQATETEQEARRRGARRTALVVAAIAVAIFLLSIWQMFRFS
jgi:ferric-dicitrate binding protein FerR (iron transport regulator)